jgi:ketosteroid isomerase-like protein
LRIYATKREALEAAGLRPDATDGSGEGQRLPSYQPPRLPSWLSRAKDRLARCLRHEGEGPRSRGAGRVAMSQGRFQIVRKPLRVRERSSRSVAQRIALRFPSLSDAYARMIGRLPPRSRFRQRALWRGVRDGLEAWNRRDWDVALAGLDPDCELHPPRKFVESALMEACYRGRAGYREFVSSWSEVFGADLRLEPVELIDLGDRIVVLADVPGRGQGSGAPFTQQWAFVSTLKDGSVIHHQQYLDHAEALEAAGLSE